MSDEKTNTSFIKELGPWRIGIAGLVVLIACFSVFYSIRVQDENHGLVGENARLSEELNALKTAPQPTPSDVGYTCMNFTIYPPRMDCPGNETVPGEICYLVGNQAMKVNQTDNPDVWVSADLELCRKDIPSE